MATRAPPTRLHPLNCLMAVDLIPLTPAWPHWHEPKILFTLSTLTHTPPSDASIPVFIFWAHPSLREWDHNVSTGFGNIGIHVGFGIFRVLWWGRGPMKPGVDKGVGWYVSMGVYACLALVTFGMWEEGTITYFVCWAMFGTPFPHLRKDDMMWTASIKTDTWKVSIIGEVCTFVPPQF